MRGSFSLTCIGLRWVVNSAGKGAADAVVTADVRRLAGREFYRTQPRYLGCYGETDLAEERLM